MFHYRFAAIIILVSCIPFAHRVLAQPAARAIPVLADSESPTTLKIFTLKYANARDVQRMIGDLSEQPSPDGLASSQLPRTTFDLRTNSLIIVGSTDDLEVIAALVEQLDVPADESGAATEEKVDEATLANFRRRIDQLERELAHIKADLRHAPADRGGQNAIDAAESSTPESPVVRDGTALRFSARAPQGGHTVINVVPAGAHVRKGEVILEVDTTPIEERIRMHKSELQHALSAAIESQAALKHKQIQAVTLVDEAKSKISMATVTLREFQEGTFALDRKMHETEVSQLKRRLKNLTEREEAGLDDLEPLQSVKEELEFAEQKLQVYLQFTAPRLDHELEMLVGSARRELALVRSQTESDIQAAQANVSAQEARVQQAEAELNRLHDELTKCKLVAPHDGVVAAGPRPIVAGSILREGQILLVLVPNNADGPAGNY